MIFIAKRHLLSFSQFFLLLGLGCQLTAPAGDKSKSSGPETVWTVLADCVADGKIADSTKLELIVKRLRSHGDIDDNAVEKFYAAFPWIKDKEVSVTKEDAVKIRAL